MRAITEADLQPETLEAGIAGRTTHIAVLPRLGANLVSLQVDEREFIHFDAGRLLTAEPHMTGCFHMFPTPCRLRNSRYSFEGREIVQQKRGEVINIHGLIRDEEFELEKGAQELIARLALDTRHPVHEGFPFPGVVAITYRLLAGGVEVRFSYENRSDRNAPVGYGIHPFWAIPPDRAAEVRVPAEHRLELDDPVSQVPTGRLIPVAGTEYDLRDWRSLKDLFIDDVFFPRPPDAEAGVRFPGEGVRLRIEASANLRHLICYSPRERPFVCVENLSAAPDAQNLYARGCEEVSGLTIVPPGGRLEAWVRYRVEGM